MRLVDPCSKLSQCSQHTDGHSRIVRHDRVDADLRQPGTTSAGSSPSRRARRRRARARRRRAARSTRVWCSESTRRLRRRRAAAGAGTASSAGGRPRRRETKPFGQLDPGGAVAVARVGDGARGAPGASTESRRSERAEVGGDEGRAPRARGDARQPRAGPPPPATLRSMCAATPLRRSRSSAASSDGASSPASSLEWPTTRPSHDVELDEVGACVDGRRHRLEGCSQARRLPLRDGRSHTVCHPDGADSPSAI